MARLPKLDATASEYARFSVQGWHDLDDFYGFWASRWKRVLDYIRGLHWRLTQEIDMKQIPTWKRFPVINFVLELYSDYLTQFLQSRVRFSAVAASPEAKDIASAELGEQVLRYLWDKLEVENTRIDLAAWLLATGNADMRVFWNNDTGDMIPLAQPQTSQDGQQTLVPINPETGQPDPTMERPVMVDAGEIGLEVVPPQMVRWVTNKSQGVMLGFNVSYDEAMAKYGEKAAESLSYSKISDTLSVDFLHAIPGRGSPLTDDAALVIEHHIPRSTRNPGGLWWTASGHQLLTPPQPLPARFPSVAHFRWVPMPGHPFLGISPLHDLSYSNKNYDEMVARIMEWLNKVVPKVVRRSGDGQAASVFTDEPFQEVTFAPGAEPVFPDIPAPPEHFFKLKQDIREDMMDVGGYKLRRPKEVPGGEATARFRAPPKLLGEGEQVALAVMNSKAPWQKLGYLLLDYAARFYDEPRVLSVIGADRTYQWREFKGSDLANLTAVIHVDELPLYTWNRQSQKDTVVALLGSPAAGVLFAGADGQPDRKRINAAIDATGIDVQLDSLDPDVLEARNENNDFSALQEGGQPPKIEPWQNDVAHLDEHRPVLKSRSFRSWPEPSRQAFLQHVGEHEKRQAEQAQQAQQQGLDQERQLREIRAQAESGQDIRTALGEKLVEAFFEVMLNKQDNSKSKKE